MRFKPEKIEIKDGNVVTSLYHSPFDYNLLYLICLAKTGVNLKIILDDIDNIGIDRSNPDATFSYREKYFFSKTERTNIRPLSLTLPKHLFANLAVPSLKELDAKVGINKLKSHQGYNDTVDHWIQEITSKYGVYSLIGPDRAFAYNKIDKDFVESIAVAKRHILKLLLQFNSEKAIKFINWLFSDEPVIGDTISHYYSHILFKIIHRFDLEKNVTVERMSDQYRIEKNASLLNVFLKESNLKQTYTEALSFDSRKSNLDLPFYSIAKENGRRLLPVDFYTKSNTEYVIAPKVLFLNNLENLVLPYQAIDKPNIFAREVMYRNKLINANQVFCDDKWFERISSFDIKAVLDEVESKIYGRDSISLLDLASLSEYDLTTDDLNKWVSTASIKAISSAKYPIIFLALLEDDLFYKQTPAFYRLVENNF